MGNYFDSRLGTVLIILYATLSLIVFVAQYFCATDVCAAYLVVPILPWAYIFSADMSLNLPVTVYPVLMLLNVSVLYVLGAVVEHLYKAVRAKRDEPTFLRESATAGKK